MRFAPLSLLASLALVVSIGCDAKQEKEEHRYLRDGEGHGDEIPKSPVDEDADPSESWDSGSDSGSDTSGTDGTDDSEGVIHVVVPEFGDGDVTFHRAKPKKKRPKATPASADVGPKAVKQTQKKAEKLDDELDAVLEEIERGK